MNKSFEPQPNPPGRETDPGSRAVLFTGASIIFSCIFTGYGVMTLASGKANVWGIALALVAVTYGLYGLAILVYAYQKRGRKPVLAIQIGAVGFLIAYVFIVTMNSPMVSSLGTGLLVAIGLWCNWIAVVKIVKKPPTAVTRKV